MQWTIPGTTLRAPRQDAEHIEQQFQNLFLGGGMVLSQVTSLSGLETHTVQNWVKRGFLSPPVKKRYDLEQLCRILTINALKNALTLEKICSLLSYVNGQLTDSSDDVIDDQQLYFMFVRLAARAKELYRSEDRDNLLDRELESYCEPVAGARERVKNALRIMLTGWLASRMQQETERMLHAISETPQENLCLENTI